MDFDLTDMAGTVGGFREIASPFAVLEQIEQGVELAALDRLQQAVAPDDVGFRYAIVPKATLARRQRDPAGRLSPEETGRLVRIASLWSLARKVWGEDAAARAFLRRPHMLLGGRTPLDVALGSELGARIAEDVLGGLLYGSAA
jgi:putative toxin-antitoxin system antitoxin component (TIGR02293 family)